MLDAFAKLWNNDSLSPHGICLLWRPELIWTHAIADALIGLSYLSISIFLAYLLSRRPDIKFGWVVWCFATFILACGATHFLSIVTLWSPAYGIEAFVKAVTALASVATAIFLWPLLPHALAWPSPEQLTAANKALLLSLAERDLAFGRLQAESDERARLEALLRHAQKIEALGHLTGGLAHDYNNLIAIITMNVSRIRKKLGAQLTMELARALDHAALAADRATAITRRMMAFSRQTPLAVAETNVAEVIARIEPLLKDAVGPHRRLTLDVCDDLPLVALDPSQLESAIVNLVINARDATPPGGAVTVLARLDQAAAGTVVSIDVADTGSGMAPEIVEKAFDPFFTTKPVGKGSGLGLSQVFGFAKQLGGNVTIESLLGEGTTVCIALPTSA